MMFVLLSVRILCMDIMRTSHSNWCFVYANIRVQEVSMVRGVSRIITL